MDEIEEYDSNTPGFIKDLQESSKETMMEMIYDAIVNKKHGALNNSESLSDKINGLNAILTFFKNREEYEKCFEIKKIIDKYNVNHSS
jgi:hypothetical protein